MSSYNSSDDQSNDSYSNDDTSSAIDDDFSPTTGDDDELNLEELSAENIERIKKTAASKNNNPAFYEVQTDLGMDDDELEQFDEKIADFAMKTAIRDIESGKNYERQNVKRGRNDAASSSDSQKFSTTTTTSKKQYENQDCDGAKKRDLADKKKILQMFPKVFSDVVSNTKKKKIAPDDDVYLYKHESFSNFGRSWIDSLLEEVYVFRVFSYLSGLRATKKFKKKDIESKIQFLYLLGLNVKKQHYSENFTFYRCYFYPRTVKINLKKRSKAASSTDNGYTLPKKSFEEMKREVTNADYSLRSKTERDPLDNLELHRSIATELYSLRDYGINKFGERVGEGTRRSMKKVVAQKIVEREKRKNSQKKSRTNDVKSNKKLYKRFLFSSAVSKKKSQQELRQEQHLEVLNSSSSDDDLDDDENDFYEKNPLIVDIEVQKKQFKYNVKTRHENDANSSRLIIKKREDDKGSKLNEIKKKIREITMEKTRKSYEKMGGDNVKRNMGALKDIITSHLCVDIMVIQEGDEDEVEFNFCFSIYEKSAEK